MAVRQAQRFRRTVSVDVTLVDQTWRTGEMYVRDPDRNSPRFIAQQTPAA
jgi:hypothetical protein